MAQGRADRLSKPTSLGVALAGMALTISAVVAHHGARAQAPSQAQVAQGATLYAANCALCHGNEGRGGQGFPRPVWGEGHDLKKFKTVQGLFEYMQMTMPFDNPQKIDDAQKLAIIAFMLERNGTPAAGELTGTAAAKIAIK